MGGGARASKLAGSVMPVFAMMTAPASRRFFVSVASYGGTKPSKASAPPVVGMFVVWMLSLSATGMPCSGPRMRPCARSRSRSSASLSASRLTVIAACSLSSYIAIRVTYCSTISREVTRPCSIAVRIAGIVASITVNRDALKEADERDRERAQGRIRGPLHGIPVALKDNIQTTNMPTTGGALVFEGFTPPYEATVTKNLRDAGAIIISKTGMTELANWVAGNPPMPANYNALHGYGYNPFDPRRDPREATFDGRPALFTGGSSSGIGTNANFWAGNVGTETSGSILSPANQNMLAGIKPTVGRISRYGIIPITADQDTAGPMAKTVTDVAIMLGVLES